MTETNEVPCVAMVPSTALSDAAHAVQQLSERPHFVPLGIWYDIYPKGMAFWRQFWEKLLGHLGGYHWGQRISDTLHQSHPQFHRALLDLSKCIYMPHPDDEELCNIAPKPTPQYPLPHLWPPPGHTPVQQLPNFALSAVFPYSYPQAVLYPTQPVTPVSMPTPTPPFYHHWASSPALTLPAAKNTKPQQDFCCYQYWEYQMHTKFYRQSKAGHPPHSKGCPQAKKQKQKHSK
jgi:hypothetical protein